MTEDSGPHTSSQLAALYQPRQSPVAIGSQLFVAFFAVLNPPLRDTMAVSLRVVKPSRLQPSEVRETSTRLRHASLAINWQINLSFPRCLGGVHQAGHLKGPL